MSEKTNLLPSDRFSAAAHSHRPLHLPRARSSCAIPDTCPWQQRSSTAQQGGLSADNTGSEHPAVPGRKINTASSTGAYRQWHKIIWGKFSLHSKDAGGGILTGLQSKSLCRSSFDLPKWSLLVLWSVISPTQMAEKWNSENWELTHIHLS